MLFRTSRHYRHKQLQSAWILPDCIVNNTIASGCWSLATCEKKKQAHKHALFARFGWPLAITSCCRRRFGCLPSRILCVSCIASNGNCKRRCARTQNFCVFSVYLLRVVFTICKTLGFCCKLHATNGVYAKRVLQCACKQQYLAIYLQAWWSFGHVWDVSYLRRESWPQIHTWIATKKQLTRDKRRESNTRKLQWRVHKAPL